MSSLSPSIVCLILNEPLDRVPLFRKAIDDIGEEAVARLIGSIEHLVRSNHPITFCINPPGRRRTNGGVFFKVTGEKTRKSLRY